MQICDCVNGLYTRLTTYIGTKYYGSVLWEGCNVKIQCPRIADYLTNSRTWKTDISSNFVLLALCNI